MLTRKQREFASDYARQTQGGEPDHVVFRKYGQQTIDENSKVVAEYLYQDEHRNPYLQVRRFEPKAFLQFHWEQNGLSGHWVAGKPTGPVIPYYLPSLIAAPPDKPIYITEGEKDADNVIDLGDIEATCAPEGAGKWPPEMNRWFEGRKTIYILQDNDDAGRRHALKVAQALAPIVGEVRIVTFPELPKHGDVSNWLAMGHTCQDLIARCQAAPVFQQKLSAEPYEWVEASKLPRRDWLYPPHYIRGFMSLTLAAGGTAKSTLTMTEAIAMVTHRPLLGVRGRLPLRVWYFNLEDPMEELQRRVAAICKYFVINAGDLGDGLFINSGRTTPLTIAEDERGVARVNQDVVTQIINDIKEKNIDVVIVDPFVASHMVPENDNTKINLVVRTWSAIAEAANCSVMMVHHLRKTGGEKGTVEDGRGASSLLAAARSARVINVMSKAEAEKAKIDERQRRFHFRADIGKANLTPPPERADWYRLETVDLKNNEGVDWDQGDKVGVVVAFDYPKTDPLKPSVTEIERALARVAAGGPWRQNAQSTAEPWVGAAVAQELSLDLSSKMEKGRVARLVVEWINAGYLMVVERQGPHRETRPYVEIGPNRPR